MDNFKGLKINRNQIESLLNSEGFKINQTKINTSSKKNIEVINQNGEKIILTIYAKNNGDTTLVTNIKNDMAQEICELIHNKLKFFDISNINATISVDKAHFDDILEEIQTTFPNDLKEPKEINGGTQYNLSASKMGALTFKYFDKKNRLQLQGKALGHFSFIFMLLNDKGYNLLPKINQMQDIELTEPSVLLSEYMPFIENKLPIDVRNITATSLQLLKINAKFSDGFIILYPMIRTLEHILKKILENYSYSYGTKGFDMFGDNNDNTKVLRRKADCNMDDNCAEILSKGYTFYSKHRHSFAHLSDDTSEIRTIQPDDAKELTLECIELIEEIGSNDFY